MKKTESWPHKFKKRMANTSWPRRISSVGIALDCRAGGRGFDSRDRTNTQGLKITEKWRYSLCTASGWTFAWLGWPGKMAVPSRVGEVKIVPPISAFVLNTLTLKVHFFFHAVTLPCFLRKPPKILFTHRPNVFLTVWKNNCRRQASLKKKT